MLALTLDGLNRLVMRGLFRLRVTGATKLPETGAFVITPNHVSDLDGLAIAAALPWSQAKRLYWAGDAVRMFSNPVNRLLCRALHVFPVDADRPAAVLENARRVLQAGSVQVWFPEAWRSPDGQLQRFLPGLDSCCCIAALRPCRPLSTVRSRRFRGDATFPESTP